MSLLGTAITTDSSETYVSTIWEKHYGELLPKPIPLDYVEDFIQVIVKGDTEERKPRVSVPLNPLAMTVAFLGSVVIAEQASRCIWNWSAPVGA